MSSIAPSVASLQPNKPRRHPRVAGAWHAELQLPGFAPSRVLCTDVSEQGAGLSGGAAVLPVGTMVYLRVNLENEGEVVALGQVVHRHLDDDRAGLRFVSVAIGSVQLLYRFIQARIRRQAPPKVERVEPSLWRRIFDRREVPEMPDDLTADLDRQRAARQMERRERRRKHLGLTDVA